MKLLLSDQGMAGFYINSFTYVNLHEDPERHRIGLQYPEFQQVEHLHLAGLWIGALVNVGSQQSPRWKRCVSETNDVDTIGEIGVGKFVGVEMLNVDSSRAWYATSTLSRGEPNKRAIDDDQDGRFDEDRLDGIDNDGDGLVDEDYGAISESDYYCTFTDTVRLPAHEPIGIKVIQRSYAWRDEIRQPILPFDLEIINLGVRELRDVYIGFPIFPRITDSLYPVPVSRPLIRGYWPEVRTAFAHNPHDPGVSPFGFSILSVPRDLRQMDYFFRWNQDTDLGDSSYHDDVKYDLLSGKLPGSDPPIRDDSPADGTVHGEMYISFGPINDWVAGDTLRTSFAFLGGRELRYTPDNLYDNARAAQTMFARNYHPPFILPSPKLRIQSGDRRITLRWDPLPDEVNPEAAWDEYNALISSDYPPDHWRRRDPPEESSGGGRVFEGYRLYRSEDPTGIPTSFTLIREWDIIDSIGPKYGYDVGIEHEFIDSNIVTGKTYWYSLVSFGIPDRQIIDYVDRDGTVKQETLSTSLGSLITGRKRVNVPFSPGQKLGSVSVVPNPYRIDRSYTYESGGWEGRQRSWSEEDRLIRFIHLPPLCTIRIFSLSGDIVTTLHHDDPLRGELDWNLLSESGRAIASGLYVFSVESDYGRQIGKFVIIR